MLEVRMDRVGTEAARMDVSEQLLLMKSMRWVWSAERHTHEAVGA
jgi:hypothetical protein